MNATMRLVRLVVHRFLLVPLMRLWFGLDIEEPQRLPATGPAIIVANHNSHLDTAVLLAALAPSAIPSARPVAAADYFLGSRLRDWFFLRLVQIVPIDRMHAGENPLAAVDDALDRGSILILFPEGTRGEPGVVAPFRHGVAHLAGTHPLVPIVPVWLSGCAEAMPKGSRRIRRTRLKMTVGRPMQRRHGEPADAYAERLREAVMNLGATPAGPLPRERRIAWAA